MTSDITRLCVTESASIREALARIDACRRGIVLVVDADRRLLGTVTDGDVRRAILARINLEEPVSELLRRKAGTTYARPVTARAGLKRERYLGLLKRHNILHLPLLDEAGRVASLVTLDDLVAERELPVNAVVMAGGQGSRLHPLTAETPKPMLQVGDRPLLELIIGRLRDAGIRTVKLATHHQREKISAHFGDGRGFGVDLSYIEESRPLGTAGGLGLLTPPTETTLVMNGDILTDVDFRAMVRFHREHEADLTVGVRQYDLKVPYGVVECDGACVTGLSEKPVMGLFVNAGIYLLEPVVFSYIKAGERMDMTDVIQRLLLEGRRVVSFPIREEWVDIGHLGDYERAHQTRLRDLLAAGQGLETRLQELRSEPGKRTPQ